MTAAPRRITAFLLRVGLLTATLGIITGLFGMHIMAGAHSMAGHSMTSHGMAVTGADHAHASVELHATAAGHDDTGTDLSPHRLSAVETVSGTSSCSFGGSCPEMSAGGGACVLSAKTTSLAAPLPGTAPYELPNFGSAAAGGSSYSYSPDSPSPGDLCISRT